MDFSLKLHQYRNADAFIQWRALVGSHCTGPEVIGLLVDFLLFHFEKNNLRHEAGQVFQETKPRVFGKKCSLIEYLHTLNLSPFRPLYPEFNSEDFQKKLHVHVIELLPKLNRRKWLFAFSDGLFDAEERVSSSYDCLTETETEPLPAPAQFFPYPMPICTEDIDWRQHSTPAFQQMLDTQKLSAQQQDVVYAFIGRSMLMRKKDGDLADHWRTSIHFYGDEYAAYHAFVRILTGMYCESDTSTSFTDAGSPFLFRHDRISLELQKNELLRLALAGRAPVVTSGSHPLPLGFISVHLAVPCPTDWITWTQAALGDEYPTLLLKGCCAYYALRERTSTQLVQYFAGSTAELMTSSVASAPKPLSPRGEKRLRVEESLPDAIKTFVCSAELQPGKEYKAAELCKLFNESRKMSLDASQFGKTISSFSSELGVIKKEKKQGTFYVFRRA